MRFCVTPVMSIQSERDSSCSVGTRPSGIQLVDRLGQSLAKTGDQFVGATLQYSMSVLIWSAPSTFARSFAAIVLFGHFPTQELATSPWPLC